ncbi:MAG: general secretion pathway protein E [Verrucomicrobiales bacterium]|jgi:general secretion pathway protein E
MSQTLTDILIGVAAECGGADADALAQTLQTAAKQGKSRIEALLDSGVIDEFEFFPRLADRLGMPFQGASELDLTIRLHAIFPAKLALRHRIIPGATSTDQITLLTYDPFDLDAKQGVGQAISKNIDWALCTRQQIMDSLRVGYGVGAANFDELLEGREIEQGDDAMVQEVTVLDEDEEATVMSFVNQVFREALKERATDIHVEPLENDLRIRYRIDGSLQQIAVPPNVRLLQASLISRLKIMANLDIAERRLPQDGRINLQLDGQRIDVRVATIPSVNGESVSLRLLSRERYDFGTLGLDDDTMAKVKELLAMPNGIVLITGPTGSGKSTTLYTFLDYLNTEDTRIVTIEDPVENKLDGLVQIAVKPEINLTFAAGLRSILRGDPNVIMVGEMRDLETTDIAIRGALTGHLVFSTLHTNDAVSGITRLIDMGIEPFLIATSVRAFIAQRLVRTLCTNCKQPVDDDAYTDAYLEKIGFPASQKSKVMRAVGCRECRGSGYRGRMAIMEICTITPEMTELISDRASVPILRAQALEDEMIPLRQYGWMKVIDGATTIEEIILVTAADQERSSRPPADFESTEALKLSARH